MTKIFMYIKLKEKIQKIIMSNKSLKIIKTVKIFCLFIATFLSAIDYCSATEPTYGDIAVDKIGTIYDGDTFSVTINQWPDIIGKNIAIRINAVDTPELRGSCYAEVLKARAAKKFTVQLIRSAKKVELRNMKRDKYFRIDADVYLDGQNLAKALIQQGFGVAYSGEKKFNWCKP